MTPQTNRAAHKENPRLIGLCNPKSPPPPLPLLGRYPHLSPIRITVSKYFSTSAPTALLENQRRRGRKFPYTRVYTTERREETKDTRVGRFVRAAGVAEKRAPRANRAYNLRNGLGWEGERERFFRTGIINGFVSAGVEEEEEEELALLGNDSLMIPRRLCSRVGGGMRCRRWVRARALCDLLRRHDCSWIWYKVASPFFLVVL